MMTRLKGLRGLNTGAASGQVAGSPTKFSPWQRRAALGTAAIISLGGLSLFNLDKAAALPSIIWINDASFVKDYDLTDGVCDVNKASDNIKLDFSTAPGAIGVAGAQPRCNLMAALQQLNSTAGYAGYDSNIVIKVDPDWIASLTTFYVGGTGTNNTYTYASGFLANSAFDDTRSNTEVDLSLAANTNFFAARNNIAAGSTPYLLRDVRLANNTTIKNLTQNLYMGGNNSYNAIAGANTYQNSNGTIGSYSGTITGNAGNSSYRMMSGTSYASMPGRKSTLNPNCLNVGQGVAGNVGGTTEDSGALFLVAPRAANNTPASKLTPAACNQGVYDAWNYNSVTIDLGYQLSWNLGRTDGYNEPVFFLNGSNITLRGIHNIYTGESSIYVGPRSENVTLTDGFVRTPGYGPERYLVVRGGAKNTTLKNHTISGFADNSWNATATWVTLTETGPTYPVDGFTVDRVRYLSPAGADNTRCNNNYSTSCGSNGIQISVNTGQYVTGLRFTRNYMEYLNRADNKHSQMIDANDAKFVWTNTVTASWGVPGNTANSNTAECVSWGDANLYPPDLNDYYNSANGTFTTTFPVYSNDTAVACNPGGGTANGTIYVIDNLVQSPLVRNSGEALLGFDNATLNNLIVRDNTVLNFGNSTANTTAAAAAEFLSLPSTISGSVEVRGNYLSHPAGAGTNAIYWNGKITDRTSPGNLANSKAVITQNYFDWRISTTTNSVIKLTQTGLVDVSLNLYGAGSVSQSTPTTAGALAANEEFNVTQGGLLTHGTTAQPTVSGNSYTVQAANNALSANAKMNTWWPVKADPAVGCVIPLTIAPPSDSDDKYDVSTSGARYPTGNHYVDVYWTAQNDAEVFIGRFPVSLTGTQSDGTTGTSQRATLTVPLPLPAPQGAVNAIRADLVAGSRDVPGYLPGANAGGGLWASLDVATQNDILASLSPSSRMLSGYPLVPTYKGIGAPKYNPTDTWPYGAGYPDTDVDPTRQVIAPAAGPVDPVSGNISGYLRLQTVDPTAGQTAGVSPQHTMPAVSQFSRVVPISGKCAPTLTLNQASTQADASSARFLHFTLTSDMSLDVDTIDNFALLDRAVSALTQSTFDGTPTTNGTFDLTASKTPYCSVDPSTNTTQVLCNAVNGATWVTFNSVAASPADLGVKIVSIQAVDGVVNKKPVSASDNQVFDIVVSLDDSGIATLTLAANKVTAAPSTSGNSTCITLPGTSGNCMVNASTNLAGMPFGLPNPQAATFFDNQVTFLNPLRVTPSLTSAIINQLIPGDSPDEANILAKSYAITLASKAIEPMAPVVFTATPSVQPGAPVVPNGVALETYQGGGPTGNYDVTLNVGTGAAIAGSMVTSAQAWPSGIGGMVLTLDDAAHVTGSTATATQPMWVRAACLVGLGDPAGDSDCQVLGGSVVIDHGRASSDDLYYYNLYVPSATVHLFSSSAAPRLDIAGYVLDSQVTWPVTRLDGPASAVWGNVWVNTNNNVWQLAMDPDTTTLTGASGVFDQLCTGGLVAAPCYGATSNSSGQAIIDEITDPTAGWRKVCDTYGGWDLTNDRKISRDCVAAHEAMEKGKPVCFVYTAINTPPLSVFDPSAETGSWPALLENVDFFTNDGTLHNDLAKQVSEVQARSSITLPISGFGPIDVSGMADGYILTVPALPRDGYVQVMSCGISHPDGAEPEEVQE